MNLECLDRLKLKLINRLLNDYILLDVEEGYSKGNIIKHFKNGPGILLLKYDKKIIKFTKGVPFELGMY